MEPIPIGTNKDLRNIFVETMKPFLLFFDEEEVNKNSIYLKYFLRNSVHPEEIVVQFFPNPFGTVSKSLNKLLTLILNYLKFPSEQKCPVSTLMLHQRVRLPQLSFVVLKTKNNPV